MGKTKITYVKGVVEQGKPADIYYYTDVNQWDVERFLDNFDYLVNTGVSKINVHINTCGGNVIEGMSVFSRILDCQIPTACYNDGLAASMGSVIWAAGKEVYMKDYSLLMIHNPFIDEDGKTYNEITDAFKKQIQTIYKQRFGLADEVINSIMNGNDGQDGTWLTAEEAVEKGFIPAQNVIKTPAVNTEKVNNIIKESVDIVKLKSVMNAIMETPKKSEDTLNNNFLNKKKMNENEITVLAALLGMSQKTATVENLSEKITDIKAKAEKFDALKATNDKLVKERENLKTELEGAKASVKNLTDSLQEATDSLKAYKEAEEKARELKIENLVNDAIKTSKIDKADKETWISLAQNNFELAKKTLDAIPTADKISKKISDDIKNEKDAQSNLKTEEQKMQEMVDSVVGKNFQFRSFGE